MTDELPLPVDPLDALLADSADSADSGVPCDPPESDVDRLGPRRYWPSAEETVRLMAENGLVDPEDED